MEYKYEVLCGLGKRMLLDKVNKGGKWEMWDVIGFSIENEYDARSGYQTTYCALIRKKVD